MARHHAADVRVLMSGHLSCRRRGEEANALRGEHNRLVAGGLSDKQARFAAQQAVRGVTQLQQVHLPVVLLGCMRGTRQVSDLHRWLSVALLRLSCCCFGNH